MYQGVDTIANITADQARLLAANGVSFVARYLAPGKTLTAQEVKNLREAGLAIRLCWETTANRIKGGAAAGAADGDAARRAAERLGIPEGTVIFFACDYDAPASDFASIEAYLRTAKYNVEPYGVGLYGPERVVAEMSARGACYYHWQCVAWSNQFLPCADVRQYAWQGDVRAMDMAKKCGIGAVDLDSAETLEGMWEAEPSAPRDARIAPNVILSEQSESKDLSARRFFAKVQNDSQCYPDQVCRGLSFPPHLSFRLRISARFANHFSSSARDANFAGIARSSARPIGKSLFSLLSRYLPSARPNGVNPPESFSRRSSGRTVPSGSLLRSSSLSVLLSAMGFPP